MCARPPLKTILKKRFVTASKLTSANWDSETSLWTLTVAQTDTGESVQISCNFLHMCAGYYSYEQAHDPKFPSVDAFKGKLIHPQFWPEDLNYEDKKVVVIGSGATAVTLVPSMAEKAASVTMLQRSPTYYIAPLRGLVCQWIAQIVAPYLGLCSNTSAQYTIPRASL